MREKTETFMNWVQLHERAWGNEVYPGRPSLDAIMGAPCVTFWRPLVGKYRNERYLIRLYTRQAELEHYLLRQLYRSPLEMTKERLSRIFIHRQLYAIERVRLYLKPVPAPGT
jgi:hypothetical protein